jgi:hypothetical protein
LEVTINIGDPQAVIDVYTVFKSISAQTSNEECQLLSIHWYCILVAAAEILLKYKGIGKRISAQKDRAKPKPIKKENKYQFEARKQREKDEAGAPPPRNKNVPVNTSTGKRQKNRPSLRL